MLKPNIVTALNEQLKHEEKNERLYLQLAGICEVKCYMGAAKWFYAASKDENTHKMKIAKYLADRDEMFVISEQKAPTYTFTNILDMFKLVYETEQNTTKALSDLYKQVFTDLDFVTSSFLYELLMEQIEEEDKVQTILHYIELTGTAAPGLAMIDDKLAELAG